ncbi:serine hydrolase domain-containing protein [Herbaspirillum sp. NPDC101397]|uniref:serine hydrolase domain-containing protein n=1 Tax=Herbaspirillum sp. NPDC101397 TaxID=3364006 RepID=UPI00383B0856
MSASPSPSASPPVSSGEIAIAVVRDGRLVRGDLHAPPVPWWSFTKTVLAAAALSLVRDGKLTLDAPLPAKPYTLRQLLRHSAGVPNYSDLESYAQAVARGDAPWPAEEMLARVDADTLLFAPDAGWRYSNTGYFLVRRLIEETTGLSLQHALEQLVLTPLGVQDVMIAATPDDLVATAWGNADGYHPDWVYHGLLLGSPAAAALLLDRLLTTDFLPPALLAEMLRKTPLGESLPGRPARNFGYGAGLMIADGAVGHTGAGPGSVAAVYRYASTGCTVAAFAPAADQALVEWAACNAVAS